MESKTPLSTVVTFGAAVLFGCGAAIAIASTAAVSKAAPSLRTNVHAAPPEVIRLEPVVVTISKSAYDSIRDEARSQTEFARSNETRKVPRG